MIFKNASFRTKVMGVIILVSVLSLLVACGFFFVYEIVTFQENTIDNLSSLAQAVGANSASALLFDDEEAARETLAALSAEDEIIEAGLFDNSGTLFVRYSNRPHLDKLQTPITAHAPGSISKDGTLTVFKKIHWKSEQVGSIYITASNSVLKSKLRQYTGLTIICLMASLLASFILASTFHHVVFDPIYNITRTARHITERNDYSIRAEDAGRSDELGVLVRGFNLMLDQIDERDTALHNAHDELENKVQERTKALTDEMSVRKKAQAETQTMGQMLKGILENISVVTFRINKEGIFTESIGKGLEALGLEENQVVGMNAFEMYPQSTEAIKSAMGGKMQIAEVSGSANNKDWTFVTYFMPDTYNPGSVVGLGLDISDRKAVEEQEKHLQEQLDRAKRMESLGVLAGGVAHDLNNILGPLVVLPELIISDIQAFSDGSSTSIAESVDDLNSIEDSAKRAASVIKDLMTMGRRFNMQKKSMDLNNVLLSFFDSSEYKNITQSNRDIEVSQNLAANSLFIDGSESHLFRILANLTRNACEAMYSHGKLSIKSELIMISSPMTYTYDTVPVGSYAKLSIADTGTGIPAEHIEHIFEPFYTKKKQTSRSGSGLGLSVVHGSIKDHDGYINVKSSPEKGTTFELFFPISEATPEHTVIQDFALETEAKILVIDDEPAQRRLAERTLSSFGYNVTTAINGHDGIRILNEEKKNSKNNESPFDIIMIDMIMEEDFDGLDTMNTILETNPKQHILLCSGFSANDRAEAGLKAGALWIEKPYTKEQLAKAIHDKLNIST